MFSEALPSPGCPPTDAAHPDPQIVLRLVPGEPLTTEHFLSHNALGKKCPFGCDPCQWASCSVFVDGTPPDKLRKMRKLPNLAHLTWIATFRINQQSGLSKRRGHHMDLWFYQGFDPILTGAAQASANDV
jgi:hypothetical protein